MVKQTDNAVPVRLREVLGTQLLAYFPEIRDVPPPTPTRTSSSR